MQGVRISPTRSLGIPSASQTAPGEGHQPEEGSVLQIYVYYL